VSVRHAHSGHLARARLRRVLVRLARTLSLDQADLATYARAECGRPWQALRQPDLLLLVDSLREIAACRDELRRLQGARRTRGPGG
jgi:hypothetical protein